MEFARYFSRPVQRVLVVIPIILILLLTFYRQRTFGPLQMKLNSSDLISKPLNNVKTILIWNAYSRFELEVFGEGHDTFEHCPIRDCFITKNRSWTPLRDFDAVIFNMPPLSLYKFPVDAHRRPDQRYIFFSQEPPTYIGEEVDVFNHLFNWVAH